MSDFLPGPAWRVRAGARRRGVAIALTFSLVVLLGAAGLALVLALLALLDAPGSVFVLAWLVPTLATTVWAVRTDTPGTVSDLESQSWSEYVVRFVMVGAEQPRPTALRVVTGVIFGGPLACYFLVVGALALLGLL